MTPTERALVALRAVHEDWCAAVWRADQANTDRARAMGAAYRAGATLEEIGATIGVGHSAVHHAMRRAGLTPADLRGERAPILSGDDLHDQCQAP